MWKRVSGIAGKKWLIREKSTLLRFLGGFTYAHLARNGPDGPRNPLAPDPGAGGRVGRTNIRPGCGICPAGAGRAASFAGCRRRKRAGWRSNSGSNSSNAGAGIRRRSQLEAAGPEPGFVPERHQWLQAAHDWTDLLRAWPALWLDDLRAAQEPAGPSLDA